MAAGEAGLCSGHSTPWCTALCNELKFHWMSICASSGCRTGISAQLHNTAGPGAGSVSHVDHAHHVTVDVLFTMTEYIREANRAGGGCTSMDIQRCILQQHQLHIPDRVLRNVLSSMGYRYGRGHIIGRMNDAWYVARVRTFLLQNSEAVVEQLQGRCVLVYTDESYVNVNHPASSHGTIPTLRRRATWCDLVAQVNVMVTAQYSNSTWIVLT